MNRSISDIDASSSDDNDISSSSLSEDDDNDLSTSEDDHDDTSSADDDDHSSAENYGDKILSVESKEETPSIADAQEDQPTSNHITTTIRPNSRRPNISFEVIKQSTIASKLPDFLAQMRAANQELEEEKSAGTLANRCIEIDETYSATQGEQHIEMNLGLGVLEEKNYDTSTTTESDSSNEDGEVDIMEKLLGVKRKRGLEDEDVRTPKKAKIQEV